MIGADVTRHLFDVEEYRWMGRVGILSPDDRVELVSGEVVEMAPIGSLHQSCVDVLTFYFGKLLGDGYVVRVQGPVQLGEFSETQPDLAILKRRDDFYRTSHPTASDAAILVEVSDSTLSYDRNTKLPLYAAAGIREVWLLDLSSRTVEIHTSPKDSAYSETKVFKATQTAASLEIPEVSVPVDEIFG